MSSDPVLDALIVASALLGLDAPPPLPLSTGPPSLGNVGANSEGKW